ncbi:MAG: hypothetical protein HQK61_04980 [Desulfamplus sp.]|nr:hypothetical protein [Desulfamplus sp.]
MDTDIKEQWVYVVVQDPETSSEELMGFAPPSGHEVKEPFIPAFETKEEAQQCFLIMPKDLMTKKYEIQAMIKEDLISQAKERGYKIFLMDEKSSIKKEIE